MASRGLADPDLKRNGPHSGPCDSAISVLLLGGGRPAGRASHKGGLTGYGGGLEGGLREGPVGGAPLAATRRCSDMWLAL
jgi:hypothetical protein